MSVKQTHPVTCAGVLADGTNCAQSADTGRYCPEHVRFEARDLDMLKLASEHFRLDLQLFWQRGSLFLLMNTAVATVYASASQAALRPVLSVFGLITAVFWFLVMRASAYWIDHWRQELARLEIIATDHRFFTRMSEDTASRPWLVPSEVSKWLPAVLAAGWFALFIGCLSQG
jgi:hypothetical protein